MTTFGIFVQLDDAVRRRPGAHHRTRRDYFQYDEARHELRGERTGKRFQLTDRVTVQVARVDLEARRIEFDWYAARTGAASRRWEPSPRSKERRKGESAEERQARRAASSALKLRDVDKRERARSGKRGVGGGANLRRGRGRGR